MNWKKTIFKIFLYLFLLTTPALIYFCTCYASTKDEIDSLEIDELSDRVEVAGYSPMSNISYMYYIQCKNLSYNLSNNKGDISTLKELFLKFTLLNDSEMVITMFKLLIATLLLFFFLFIYYNKYMRD